MPEDPAAEARARLDAQAEEYGTYVAVNAIAIDGVRAFNPGDPVPKSHVERGLVSDDDVRLAEQPAADVEADAGTDRVYAGGDVTGEEG